MFSKLAVKPTAQVSCIEAAILPGKKIFFFSQTLVQQQSQNQSKCTDKSETNCRLFNDVTTALIQSVKPVRGILNWSACSYSTGIAGNTTRAVLMESFHNEDT